MLSTWTIAQVDRSMDGTCAKAATSSIATVCSLIANIHSYSLVMVRVKSTPTVGVAEHEGLANLTMCNEDAKSGDAMTHCGGSRPKAVNLHWISCRLLQQASLNLLGIDLSRQVGIDTPKTVTKSSGMDTQQRRRARLFLLSYLNLHNLFFFTLGIPLLSIIRQDVWDSNFLRLCIVHILSGWMKGTSHAYESYSTAIPCNTARFCALQIKTTAWTVGTLCGTIQHSASPHALWAS